MADEAPTVPTLETLEPMFQRLPREQDAQEPEQIQRRVRLRTREGRTYFAFVRAGRATKTSLSFAGWDATNDVEDLKWDYFVLASMEAGGPLQLICRRGPLGELAAAELEEKSQES
jgi:hypothetical protein